VLVICGFKGFPVWYSRCSGFVLYSFAFPGLANRRTVIDKGLEKAIKGRRERNASRKVDIVTVSIVLTMQYWVESIVKVDERLFYFRSGVCRDNCGGCKVVNFYKSKSPNGYVISK